MNGLILIVFSQVHPIPTADWLSDLILHKCVEMSIINPFSVFDYWHFGTVLLLALNVFVVFRSKASSRVHGKTEGKGDFWVHIHSDSGLCCLMIN